MAHELCVRKTPESQRSFNQWALCKNMKSLPGVRRLASHTSWKVPSLSSLESGGHRGTGEIVLTRLSLTTNWLPAVCSSEREGRLQVFVSFLEGFGFLKGSSWKTVADRSTTEGKALGMGWGRIEINISRRKTFPNFSASCSFSSSILGREAGARLFQKAGIYLGKQEISICDQTAKLNRHTLSVKHL